MKIIPVLLTMVMLCGCASMRAQHCQFEAKIQQGLVEHSMAISLFKCEDPYIAEAVRSVFIAELSERGIRVVEKEQAKIVINGVITINFEGASSSDAAAIGNAFGFGAGQSGRASYGKYVTGVTALATEAGELVASASYSQTRKGKGVDHSPEEMAKGAARKLVDAWKRRLQKAVKEKENGL